MQDLKTHYTSYKIIKQKLHELTQENENMCQIIVENERFILNLQDKIQDYEK